MFIHIDPANGLAIYDQLVRQVKFAVADGHLQPGELVPSVRELARTLAINPNTVNRAYRQLQNEGILQTVRGTGLEVRPGASAICRAERMKLIGQRLRWVLVEARQSGLTAAEIRQLIDTELGAMQHQEEKPDGSSRSG